jgi:hypothetical protein
MNRFRPRPDTDWRSVLLVTAYGAHAFTCFAHLRGDVAEAMVDLIIASAYYALSRQQRAKD